MLTYTRGLPGQEVVTSYTYQGDQLVTAKASNDPTTWQYTYDVEGRLAEVTPGGSPGAGARRYFYDLAGRLNATESHNGTLYVPQAQGVWPAQENYALG